MKNRARGLGPPSGPAAHGPGFSHNQCSGALIFLAAMLTFRLAAYPWMISPVTAAGQTGSETGLSASGDSGNAADEPPPALGAPAQEPAHATPRQATSAPTSRPAGPVQYQPGVWIDWRAREVLVQTHVVLRRGELEFLACWPGKEHESIVRFDAAAAHVYQALGLIGVLPGHPPVWNEQRGAYDAPTGDLVDISFRWDTPDGPRNANAFDWLREIEYGRTPLPRPWVFCGSVRLRDGALASDVTGVGVSVVDFPDSLLGLSRRHPAHYGELWVEVNTPAVPAEHTPVRMVLRAAEPRNLGVELDFRGVAFVDGRYCSAPDLADLLRLERQLKPDRVQPIIARGTLASDLVLFRHQMTAAGLPEDALRIEHSKEPE